MEQVLTQLPFEFNANEHDPEMGGSSLPIGKHLFEITGGEVKATTPKETGDQPGGYVKLNVSIVEGEFAGSQGSFFFNLYSNNDTAKKIAHSRFSALSHCVGVFNVRDTKQLIGKRLYADIGPQKNDPSRTEPKKFFDLGGNLPNKKSAGGQTQQGQTSGFGGAQPQQSQPSQNTPRQGFSGQQSGFGQQPQQNGFGGQQPLSAPQGGFGGQQAQQTQQQSGWGAPGNFGGQQPQNNNLNNSQGNMSPNNMGGFGQGGFGQQ